MIARTAFVNILNQINFLHEHSADRLWQNGKSHS